MTDKELAKEYVDKLYAEKVSKEDYDKDGWILYRSEDISDAFLAGLKAGKDTNVSTKWHDLRNNPNDLPKEYSSVLADTEYAGYRSTRICNYHYGKWWVTSECAYETGEVIAWCEIPQYTEE